MRQHELHNGPCRDPKWPVGPMVLLLLLGACTVHLQETRRTVVGTRPLAMPLILVEETLPRGTASADDVRGLLGEPQGHGSLLLPGQTVAQEAWYYEHFAMTQAGGVMQSTQLYFDQDVLLVFFRDGVVDGFLWFSDGEISGADSGGEP